MRHPELDLESIGGCLGWAMALAERSGEPFTLRQAKRLMSSSVEMPPDVDWLRAIVALEDEGDLRTYVTPRGKPGRPTTLYYPVHHIEATLDEHAKLGTLDTGEPVSRAPWLGDLVEVHGTEVKPPKAEPALQAAAQPPEQTNQPEQTNPFAPPLCEYCGAELDVFTMTDDDGKSREHAACVNRECPGPDGAEAATREPDPQPEDETPKPVATALEVGTGRDDARDEAYRLMRNLITKSVEERDGIGCTSEELKWILERKGYSEDDAVRYIRDLAGQAPEAYYEGGLRIEGPFSARNRTQEPRFFLRTKAQAFDPEMAAFEAQKARSNAKS